MSLSSVMLPVNLSNLLNAALTNEQHPIYGAAAANSNASLPTSNASISSHPKDDQLAQLLKLQPMLFSLLDGNSNGNANVNNTNNHSINNTTHTTNNVQRPQAQPGSWSSQLSIPNTSYNSNHINNNTNTNTNNNNNVSSNSTPSAYQNVSNITTTSNNNANIARMPWQEQMRSTSSSSSSGSASIPGNEGIYSTAATPTGPLFLPSYTILPSSLSASHLMTQGSNAHNAATNFNNFNMNMSMNMNMTMNPLSSIPNFATGVLPMSSSFLPNVAKISASTSPSFPTLLQSQPQPQATSPYGTQSQATLLQHPGASPSLTALSQQQQQQHSQQQASLQQLHQLQQQASTSLSSNIPTSLSQQQQQQLHQLHQSARELSPEASKFEF
eukprot:TRINITY_DN4119_c0_g3_i3.p1 TRINITY_DN4119_c0_g3~~TRINITY_DN4119_c0_g3_i3.p1  ORF type:complete len:385 (+),score=110.71 TRINITY_DN4119_c0_g3_i3:312-1466(+)